MTLSQKLLISLAVPVLLMPGLASALTVEGSTVYGLPANTPFVLKLDNGQTTGVTSDAQGQVTLTEEDDDDDNTLFLWPGGNGDLINERTGEVVGELRGGVLGAAGMAWMGSSQHAVRGYANFGVARLDFTGLEANADNGLSDALSQGFDAFSDADTDATGGVLGLGLLCGDEANWGNKGSVLWGLELTYRQYEEMDAVIDGFHPEFGSVLSQSTSEVSSLGVSFGPHMYLADNFAVYGLIGYTWYETEDSGNIRQSTPDGSFSAIVGSFSEEDVDGTGTFEVGASYQLTDRLNAYLSYQLSFKEVGSAKADQPQVLGAGVRVSF